jgi:predicted TPR repeat methyltransferase
MKRQRISLTTLPMVAEENSTEGSEFETLQAKGFQAVKEKDIERALVSFKQALLCNPHAVSVHNNLSNVYTQLKNSEAALAHLHEALRLQPQHAESYNNLGRLLYKQARIAEAIPYFEKALRIDPNYWEAHYNLAHSLSSLNQLNRAAAHYQEVIRIIPEHSIAHFNLGLIYVAEENYTLAEVHLNKAIIQDPHNVEALRQLGQVYVQQGHSEEALQTYQKALDLDPTLADVHHNLAILYLRQSERAKALVHFTEALKQDPTNDTAKHMVMALSNTESNSTPPAYITQLFDQYADYYDEHLKTKLKYNAPGLLRNAVGRSLQNNPRVGRVLDLGCGTGLCGIYFRDMALDLIGVDLSPKMIEKARALGAYEKLVVADFNNYLTQPDLEPFQLIIACDVLVYSGDLATLFKNINRVLLPGGYFAFTTEILDQDNIEISKNTDKNSLRYHLQPTGRFAHSNAYIHELAKCNQLRVLCEENIILREQEGIPIHGQLWVLS